MKSKEIKFTSYDTAEFLRTPEEIAEYLEAAFQSSPGDSGAVLRALGTAARAYGMQKIAEATGLQRQGLYKSLSERGNPSFDTIVKVMDVFGVQLRPMMIKRRESPLRGPPANDTGPSGIHKTRKGRMFVGELKRDPKTGEMTPSARRKVPTRKHA